MIGWKLCIPGTSSEWGTKTDWRTDNADIWVQTLKLKLGVFNYSIDGHKEQYRSVTASLIDKICMSYWLRLLSILQYQKIIINSTVDLTL